MYAVYNYVAGASQANIIADVVKMLTGETNKANLSADCVQANTSITASFASAGWSVYDASAGTNYQVLRALNNDGSTYKYVGVKADSSSVWRLAIYESWNSSTHVATNPAENAISGTSMSWNPTAGGYIYIYASARSIVIRNYHSSTWQARGGGLVFEYSRDMVPASYPCHIISNSGNSTYSAIGPRTKNVATTGDYASGNAGSNIQTTHAMWSAGHLNQYFGNQSVYNRDASETVTLVLSKIDVYGDSNIFAANIGNFRHGSSYDIYTMHNVIGGMLDEVTISGQQYIIFTDGLCGNGYNVVVPKG